MLMDIENLRRNRKDKMDLKFEKMPNLNTVIMYIEKCEGKHIQQVVYSTYHKALTQICYGCKKIRSDCNFEEVQKR